MQKLVIFRGQAVENETRLAGRPVRLGRDSKNDIVLDDKSVSRFHAEIRPEGDKYFIVDLKSRNGVWVNGQQAKGKTALALGAPVTLGAFELTIEDDVSTGEFDEESPLLAPAPRTMINAPTDQSSGASRSATRAAMKAPAATSRRQMILWLTAAGAVVSICAITFVVIRYRRPAAPVEVATITPPLPPTPTMPIVVPAETPADDPTKVTIDRHLADGQAAVGKGDLAAARDHVARVLELDPANQPALELKQKVDAGLARGAKPPPPPTVTTVPPVSPEVETPGIAKRANETWPAYTGRVEGIRVNLETGKAYLAKNNYAQALARFRLVAADAPRYQGVDQLIVETLAKQKVALETAINSGDQNEKAGKLKDARTWYQVAVGIDPSALSAHEKDVALLNRMTPDLNRTFTRATGAAKTGEQELARSLFQQIMDSLLPGDELRDKTAKELEKLKR